MTNKKPVAKKSLKKTLTRVAKPVAKKAPVKARTKTTDVDSILELTKVAHQAILDTKGENPLVLDVREVANFCDYLVIASGTNPRQVLAMADRIDDLVKKETGRNPLSREGVETAQWVILDYGDIVCNLFTEETRELYSLEKLWQDGKIVKVPKKSKKVVAKKTSSA